MRFSDPRLKACVDTLDKIARRIDAVEFKEGAHPRDQDGKFTSGGASAGASHEEPFEKSKKVGWWRDQEHLDLYHGTHENHLEGVAKNGINVKDPKTGMVSMTLDPHTAHGYAAMSGKGGETGFRKAGAKVVNTPHEQRVTTRFRVPKAWIEANIDPRLGGNLGEAEKRMKYPEEYARWVKNNGSNRDLEYYGTSELRFSQPVPPEFYQGHQRKVKR